MSWNYYYKDRRGGQNGPVTSDELTELAKVGHLAPDCLVWPVGGEPARADSYPPLAAAFREGVATPLSDRGPLKADLPAWGMFWRGIVSSIGLYLIVPAPWAGLWLYRWLTGRITLANGRRLFLHSSVGECWYIFVGLGFFVIAPLLLRNTEIHGLAEIVASLASMCFGYLLVRWFSRALRSEDGAFRVAFEGSFWGYLGFQLLVFVSFISIIGWAWVLKYEMRWLCRRTHGSHEFDFVASGWDVLWRMFLFSLGCLFVLPIPWVLRWYLDWFISQIVVTQAAGEAKIAVGAAD